MQLHASTVVIDGAAVAIAGPTGSGKSGFALGLMNRGAQLLADDITWVRDAGDAVIAHCPPALSGQIEARGMGILTAPFITSAPLKLIVDMGIVEQDRMPAAKFATVCGHAVRVFHTPESGNFIEAVMHYMSNRKLQRQES